MSEKTFFLFVTKRREERGQVTMQHIYVDDAGFFLKNIIISLSVKRQDMTWVFR
jgi:hypothetical protein